LAHLDECVFKDKENLNIVNISKNKDMKMVNNKKERTERGAK
jgi:hypothetical protein